MRTYDCNQSKSYLIPIPTIKYRWAFQKSNTVICFQVFLEEVVTYEAEPADISVLHGFAGASPNLGCPSNWILKLSLRSHRGKFETGNRNVVGIFVRSTPHRPLPFFLTLQTAPGRYAQRFTMPMIALQP